MPSDNSSYGLDVMEMEAGSIDSYPFPPKHFCFEMVGGCMSLTPLSSFSSPVTSLPKVASVLIISHGCDDVYLGSFGAFKDIPHFLGTFCGDFGSISVSGRSRYFFMP